ncbi:bifunctional tetrahydrofolate synthase/dihydrofolate synthase [Cellvibrio mixtus]|uniref:Dihydrofolate synthase/folylpolyglutamate synthase n=1 Tax=Cellvibrio mixtus TaxID=39650 RepID=A0A266Q7E5_9GAMM|nr:bifunctional tetrahydrofolate synthase/dihydrofolate synthase [Cellvibrio mixtus]OZY85765.1 bifunctional tetrahydrofolate synthase/dihydrofolate synthase [Cellvibrio mixtus]
MQSTSLPVWLAWLEQNHPREIDLGLERIATVAKRMSLLNPTATVVTVAGTNGKGSCVAATAALLGAAGFSVGVYTSPHLIRYNERIVVDGEVVADDEICTAFNAIYSACQLVDELASSPISLTYFEYSTLAALDVFRRRNVTAMVLEVGLGGRLDAINIIDADIAVITSIALDHTDWLGDNREVIGVEKAGIMRAGKPVICADPSPPSSIAASASQLGAVLYSLNHDFGYTASAQHAWAWWSKGCEFVDQPIPQLPLPSMAAALQVAVLLGLDLTAIRAFECLSGLRVPGRFQQCTWRDREVILDVAHNPAATAYLLSRLQQSQLLPRPIHAVVAMMSDKDRVESLANLKAVVTSWYLADLSFISRAATVDELQQTLAEMGCSAVSKGSVADCLSAAHGASNPGDIILVFGSFHTVAAGLQAIDYSF